MMNSHTWEPDRIDVGPANGFNNIGRWVCRRCGVTGGKIDDSNHNWKEQYESVQPFLAGTPLVNLSDDCDEAAEQIGIYLEKYPDWSKYLDKIKRPNYP